MGLFVASLALVPLLPTAFIDVGGEPTLSVTIAPPAGASSADVAERTSQAEALLLPEVDPEVERIQSTIPGDADTGLQTLQAAFTGRDANSAVITVRLHDGVDPAAKTDELESTLAPIATDGYTVAVEEQQAFGGTGGLAIVVSGDDPAAIRTASDAIVADLSEMEDLANVASDLAEDADTVVVDVDPNKAAAYGLSAAQVGLQIRNVLVGQTLGQVILPDGTSAQTQVRIDTSLLDSVAELQQLPVAGLTGVTTLGAIATVEMVQTQGTVTRVDGSPAATVSASFTTDDQGGASREAQQRVASLEAVVPSPRGSPPGSRGPPRSRARPSAACSSRWAWRSSRSTS